MLYCIINKSNKALEDTNIYFNVISKSVNNRINQVDILTNSINRIDMSKNETILKN